MMAATMVRVLRPGAILWNADGDVATVTEIGQLGVYATISGQPLPLLLALPVWRAALTCEYCDQPAQVQVKGGQPNDVLCKSCAGGHHERPADWVRPIPKTVIRQLYGWCERLA